MDPEAPRGATFNPFDLYPLDTRAELEKLAVFAVCVAGKSARTTLPKVSAIFQNIPDTPLNHLRKLVKDKTLHAELQQRKMGQYTRISAALTQMSKLPDDWQWYHLLDVRGVGYKTAKLVQLYTWPGGECACIDRHVLRYAAATARGAIRKILPTSSPQDEATYLMWEAWFRREARVRLLPDWLFDKVLWQSGVDKTDPRVAITVAAQEAYHRRYENIDKARQE